MAGVDEGSGDALLGGWRETPLPAEDIGRGEQLAAWLGARHESVLAVAAPLAVWGWLLGWGGNALFAFALVALVGVGSLWAVAVEQLCLGMEDPPSPAAPLRVFLNNAPLALLAGAGVYHGTLGVVKYMLMGTATAAALLWMGVGSVATCRAAPDGALWHTPTPLRTTTQRAAAAAVAVYAVAWFDWGAALLPLSRWAAAGLLAGGVWFTADAWGPAQGDVHWDIAHDPPLAVVGREVALGCMVALAGVVGVLSQFLCVTSASLAGGALGGVPPLFLAGVVLPLAAGYAQGVGVARAAVAAEAGVVTHLCVTTALQIVLGILPAAVLAAAVLHQPLDLHYAFIDVAALALGVGAAVRCAATQRIPAKAGTALAAGYAVYAAAIYLAWQGAPMYGAVGPLPNGDPAAVRIQPIAKR